MTPSPYPENAPISRNAHRVLWVVTWTLFALGMLEWFLQGANRPLDPVLGDAAIAVVAPLAVNRILR